MSGLKGYRDVQELADGSTRRYLWFWLWRWFTGKPHVVIGSLDNPYLCRWHVLPHNPWGNIYLHRILRSDDDRALHDHPWWNVSIPLGDYLEVRPMHPRIDPGGTRHGDFLYRCRAFRPVFRTAETAHRLVLHKGQPTWSLFITGPKVREWGFWCPKGWVHWRDFTAGPNGREVGKGCE